MDGGKLLDGLELDDQFAANQKVGTTFSDAESLVVHGKRNLTFEWNLPTAQLHRESFFVDRLGETRSKDLVHFKGSIDNSSRQAIQSLVGFN